MQLSNEKFSKKLVSTALSGLCCEDEMNKLENSIALRASSPNDIIFSVISIVCCYSRLRLLRLVIGLKLSATFSTNEKQNQSHSHLLRTIFRALRGSALLAPIVIGRSNYFGNGF